VDELLALAETLPRQSVAAGDVLLVDGRTVESLFVLIDGALQIEKEGSVVATVNEPGACVGEMSLLLGISATATVIASRPSVLAVIADPQEMLEREPRLALALARQLAARLQTMTTYLADLREQYADHEGGLGMVDVVLGSLMRSSGPPTRLGSVRDPDPEY
jgi:CRP/FNR family transcriptional regulator, cyclic AMP receptor protein